jgi:hypothetical protein
MSGKPPPVNCTEIVLPISGVVAPQNEVFTVCVPLRDTIEMHHGCSQSFNQLRSVLLR